MDSRFLNGAFSGVLAALIQTSLFAGPYGSKANWVIAAVSAYAFVSPGFPAYVGVALTASAALYALSGFAAPSYAVFAALIAAYAIRRLFPLRPVPGYALAILVATFASYTIVDPGFIALHPYLVLFEAACTLILGLALHALLGRLYEAGRYPS